MQIFDPIVAGVAACVFSIGTLPHDPPAANAGSPTSAPLPYESRAHQTLARLAARQSKNLDHFLRDMGIRGQSYSRSYPDRAEASFRNLRVDGSQATDLVGAGAVLEGTASRRSKHFLDPVAGSGLNGQPNARDWALDGGGQPNDFSWASAFAAYEQAVAGSTAGARRVGQERLFVTLGHLTRLVQGCTNPALTRNDPGFDVEQGGRPGALDLYSERTLGDAGALPATLKAAIDGAARRWFTSPGAYFDSAAQLSNGEFFSDGSIFEGFAQPSRSGTATRSDTIGGRSVEFITSTTQERPSNGVRARLARRNRGIFFDRETLDASEDAVTADNLEILAPAAVAYGAGLIDHFLRGRILVTMEDGPEGRLEVTNNADLGTGAAAADVTLMSGGMVRLFYETADGTQLEMPSPFSPQMLNFTLEPGASAPLFGNVAQFVRDRSDAGLPDSERAGIERKVTVLYRGSVGGGEGVCASTIEFPDNLSVLLAFDVSASVTQASLDIAKDAALSLFAQLQVGNGNRVAVARFGDGAQLPWPFNPNLSTEDVFTGARTRIQALSLQGSRALFDGTRLAGNSAFGEAESRKTVMVLYSGGPHTRTTGSIDDAVGALTRARGVTEQRGPRTLTANLIHVGSGPGSEAGRDGVSDIAAGSMRAFQNIDAWTDLRTALHNSVKAGATR